jgi:lipopolysaccharide/colanic/teichoic acid biosynthesis glycosyltransferase
MGKDVARPRVRRALGALRAQQLIDVIGLRVGPALVGGLLAWLHLGDPGQGALVMVSMLVSARLIERSGFPAARMPFARFALAASTPALGAAGAALITALAGNPIALGELWTPILGAMLVTAIGAGTKERVERGAPARVAVLGTPELTCDLRDELVAGGVRAYRVIGWLGPHGENGGRDGLPRLGATDELRAAVIENAIDLVVCGASSLRWNGAGSRSARGDALADAASACVDLPVRTLSADQLYEELLGHVPVGMIDSAWRPPIQHPSFPGNAGISKRLFDLIAGGLIALLALPVLVAAAIAIKLSDGGPILFRQRRAGEFGRSFEMLKLRTMTDDAARAPGADWALPDGARVTPVGRLLRRTHANELPQLWNVLRGEMSLVGPRPEEPELVSELERQIPHYGARHLVKPGITGWAQVACGYAHSELGAAWKLCYDLYYVKHRSLLGDLMITIETGIVTFRDAHRALRMPKERFIVGEHVHG